MCKVRAAQSGTIPTSAPRGPVYLPHWHLFPGQFGQECYTRNLAHAEFSRPISIEICSLSLFHFLLVVLSLSTGSLPAAENIDWSRSLLASAGLLVGWTVLAHIAARNLAMSVIRNELDPLQGAHWIERQLQAMRWLGLGIVGLILVGFKVASGLVALPIVSDWMVLQAIGLMIPGLIMTAATWSAEQSYGVRLGYTQGGFAASAINLFQCFRGGLAWLVIPVWALMAMSDGISRLPISDQWTQLSIPIAAALFVFIGLPWLLRWVFRTQPMESSEEAWARKLLSETGLGHIKIRRWNTGGASFNAMVTGFLPWARSLMISDRLLDELPRSQIAMVILHEAAHLRRRHLPIRMLAAVPAWAIGFGVTRLFGENAWASGIGTVVGITLTLALLRIVAYRTEHDADLTACRLAPSIAGRIEGVPVTEQAAAQALSMALHRVTFDSPSSRKATWLHPSIDQRLERMRNEFEPQELLIVGMKPIPLN
jgi:Zn-dependent protease with chaperone function